MIFRYEYTGGVWIDLEQPAGEEVRKVAQEFGINERIEQELLSPTLVPTVTSEDGVVLLVLHFPTQGDEAGESKNQEVDFVVGKNFILTVRYEVVAPLHHLKKLLEAQQLVGEKAPITTDALVETLFAHLYTAMRDHTNHLADNLARIEKDMFQDRERSTVRAISAISRQFLHAEAALTNQEDPLREFLEALDHYGHFGPSFHNLSLRILLERARVARIVRTHRAVATETRETNLAILGARQNEIMKTLTIVNFIFLPLGLISWIFAMRTEGMPLIEGPHAFWTVLAIMLGVAVILTIFFIKRRWLS
jgi:magnesium transporter